MNEEVRKLIDQAINEIAELSPEAYNTILDRICKICREKHLQDDCPLGYVMFESLDETITENIRAAEAVHKMKELINKQ